MRRSLFLVTASSLAFAACTQMQPAPAPQPAPPTATAPSAASVPPAPQSTMPAAMPVFSSTNPFSSASTLQYQAPPFDKITDADYQPAIEEGMKQHLVEVDAIANGPQPATFANTIEPLERSGALLTRAAKVFFALTGSNTNDTIQKIEAEESPKLAAHQDAITLNPKLFARIKAIYDTRATSGLDAEQKFLVERYYRNFVRSGALLNDADQTTLRALNQEESTLSTKFREKVLADTAASAVVVDTKAELDGLSEGDIAAAAQRAKDKKLDGKYVLTLQNTTRQPVLVSLKNRAVRQRVFEASSMRGNHGGPNDTKAIVSRLAQLRAQRAQLLGYATYAAYSLDDQMAKTPQNALKLLNDLGPASTAKARGEAAKIQKVIDAEQGGFKVTAADWEYYADKVRKAEFDLDQSQVKPYFELDRVLHDGVFYAANQLYGLTFKERKDIPVYQPDVRVFEVFDADGKSMALFYGDYFSRPNKSGGAWMDSFVDQSGLMGTKPVVFNVTNFSKPAPGEPALLSSSDVTTMFHEFGHALHGLFSNVKYPTLAGTAVPRDFVEMPSQFNEHWALEPRVLANYAKHYKSGEPMPQVLVDKI
ncbi:MAG: M3 family metallopeptidase, partial [Acidobacteriota bacterium]